MQKVGLIIMFVGCGMVVATIEGGGSSTIAFGGIVAIVAGYFIEREGH